MQKETIKGKCQLFGSGSVTKYFLKQIILQARNIFSEQLYSGQNNSCKANIICVRGKQHV